MTATELGTRKAGPGQAEWPSTAATPEPLVAELVTKLHVRELILSDKVSPLWSQPCFLMLVSSKYCMNTQCHTWYCPCQCSPTHGVFPHQIYFFSVKLTDQYQGWDNGQSTTDNSYKWGSNNPIVALPAISPAVGQLIRSRDPGLMWPAQLPAHVSWTHPAHVWHV